MARFSAVGNHEAETRRMCLLLRMPWFQAEQGRRQDRKRPATSWHRDTSSCGRAKDSSAESSGRAFSSARSGQDEIERWAQQASNSRAGRLVVSRANADIDVEGYVNVMGCRNSGGVHRASQAPIHQASRYGGPRGRGGGYRAFRAGPHPTVEAECLALFSSVRETHRTQAYDAVCTASRNRRCLTFWKAADCTPEWGLCEAERNVL